MSSSLKIISIAKGGNKPAAMNISKEARNAAYGIRDLIDDGIPKGQAIAALGNRAVKQVRSHLIK